VRAGVIEVPGADNVANRRHERRDGCAEDGIVNAAVGLLTDATQ
jgi:hypothetical protein